MKSRGLSEIIAAEIVEKGPLPFARFMELALYHPDLGYYSSGTAKIGRTGDFYTNVSVGATFGQVLASQFQEMWERLGKPLEFIVLEQGAHDGQLARDILTAAEGAFSESLRYCVAEPEGPQRWQQEKMLAGFPVEWFSHIDKVPPFRGVHFSNELVDALPFHIIESQGDAWEELLVSGDAGAFSFLKNPLSSHLQQQAAGLPARPPGYLSELRPLAQEWLGSVAKRLIAGFILVVDYGYSREQLYAPHRNKGTFACFQHHRRDDLVLETPGEKDITAHVDFTSLAEHAKRIGLNWEGFTDQNHFMVGAGEPLLRSLEGRIAEPDARKTLRAMQTLLHPESMGTQFHYLAFSKNAPGSPPLRGFRYERGPQALNLEGAF